MTNIQLITPQEKAEIIELIITAEKTLGSATKVANKCGVSDATINLLKSDTYPAKGDTMWQKVGASLGWKAATGWVIVPDTTNTKIITQVLSDAQTESLFIPIAEKAGSGKTTSVNTYVSLSRNANIFRITCRDWSKREFLLKLCQSLGINIGNGYKSLDNILEAIIDFFQMRKGRPLLIIDQANSLKPSVLSMLIHLYNECKDKLGVVISGTEHLQVDILRGVKYSRKGYDELHSRFGRTFVHLVGYTIQDVRKMCAANGVPDKEVQDQLFHSCQPITKAIENRSIKVIEDGRTIERAIKRHLLLTAQPQ